MVTSAAGNGKKSYRVPTLSVLGDVRVLTMNTTKNHPNADNHSCDSSKANCQDKTG